jgi:hypothetical protein
MNEGDKQQLTDQQLHIQILRMLEQISCRLAQIEGHSAPEEALQIVLKDIKSDIHEIRRDLRLLREASDPSIKEFLKDVKIDEWIENDFECQILRNAEPDEEDRDTYFGLAFNMRTKGGGSSTVLGDYTDIAELKAGMSEWIAQKAAVREKNEIRRGVCWLPQQMRK